MREREGPVHEGDIDALLLHLFLRLKPSRPNLNEHLFVSCRITVSSQPGRPRLPLRPRPLG